MKINKGVFTAVFGLLISALGASSAQEGQRETSTFLDPLRRSSGPGLSLSTDEFNRTYAPESPGDGDIGDQLLLIPADSYQPFTFYGGAEGRWTSNAALTETDELDDFYWRFGVGATYLPRLVGNLYGEVSADYDWYRYTDNSFLDFESLDARAGLTHVFRELGDLSAWVRYNYSRLSDGSEELFSDHSIEIGAFKPIPLRRDHFLYFGWLSEFSLDADPGYAQRHEHSVLGGYQYSPVDGLDLGLFYRFAVHDYNEGGRTDLNHEIGAHVDYDITEAITFRVSASYYINDSDLDGADYEAGTAGGLAGIRIEF